MKDIAVIIPAQEVNRYHKEGDLAPFGGTTLLEWKITQLKNVVKNHQIYVSTFSDRVREVAVYSGVGAIRRTGDVELVDFAVFEEEVKTLVWAYVTTPFLSSLDYKKLIDCFKNFYSRDSLVTVKDMKEFVYFEDKPLNFKPVVQSIRSGVIPILVVVHGCFIISREKAENRQNYYGEDPYLFSLNPFESTEIRDISDYSLATDLLPLYFKTKGI